MKVYRKTPHSVSPESAEALNESRRPHSLQSTVDHITDLWIYDINVCQLSTVVSTYYPI